MSRHYTYAVDEVWQASKAARQELANSSDEGVLWFIDQLREFDNVLGALYHCRLSDEQRLAVKAATVARAERALQQASDDMTKRADELLAAKNALEKLQDSLLHDAKAEA